MKPQYEPTNVGQALGYLVEECGEVLAAVGKTQRWGLESTNPEIPVMERETNRDWILRELKDLETAIARVRKFLFRPYPTGLGDESRRLHREYSALEAAQRAGAKNAADVIRVTDEAARLGIILVPGGENL